MEELTINHSETGNGGGSRTVVIRGALTIESASEFKTAILKAFTGAEEVRLQFDSVSDADLTALQILCAAHRSALRKNLKIGICGEGSEKLLMLAREAGFSTQAGCLDISGASCIWRGGNH